MRKTLHSPAHGYSPGSDRDLLCSWRAKLVNLTNKRAVPWRSLRLESLDRDIFPTANTLPGCNTLWECRLCGREDLHIRSGQAREERVISLLCTIVGGVEGKGKGG